MGESKDQQKTCIISYLGTEILSLHLVFVSWLFAYAITYLKADQR